MQLIGTNLLSGTIQRINFNWIRSFTFKSNCFELFIYKILDVLQRTQRVPCLKLVVLILTIKIIYWTGVTAGSICAMFLSSIVINNLGWTSVFGIGFLAVLAWAPFWWYFIPNEPELHTCGKANSATLPNRCKVEKHYFMKTQLSSYFYIKY